MPFTPYHFGPPLFVASAIYLFKGKKMVNSKWIVVVFGLFIGSVIPDLQGIYSWFVDPTVSVHGFSHTIVGAVVYSIGGVIILWIGLRILRISQRDWVLSAITVFLGILFFHFLPDMFIWSEMNILWPFAEFYPGDESRYRLIANILSLCFISGVILALVGLFIHSVKNNSK